MIRLEISQRALFVLLAVAAGLWLLGLIWPVLLLLIVSLIFAGALLPLVEWQVRRGSSRGVAVFVVVAVMVAVAALIGLAIVPVLIEQARDLFERLPDLRDRAVRFLQRRGQPDLAREVQQLRPSLLVGSGVLADTGRQAISALTTTVTILVLTAYILFDARRIEQFLYFATPQGWHRHLRNLIGMLKQVVGGYVRGQLLTSGIIMLFAFIILTVAGVSNALALAVLIGIADMIPVIGIILVVGPATLAALAVSLPRAIIVAAALILYQEFENRILVQRIYGVTLGLPAVAVLLALLIGADLLGVAGALLSLPAAAVVRVFIQYGNAVRTGQLDALEAALRPGDQPSPVVAGGPS